MFLQVVIVLSALVMVPIHKAVNMNKEQKEDLKILLICLPFIILWIIAVCIFEP